MSDHWIDPLSTPVDKILFGEEDTPSPGICEITGLSSPRNWDIRRGYGLNGGIAVFRGKGVAKFGAKFRLYTPEDWQDYFKFKPILDQIANLKGIKVYHPFLWLLGIGAVVVEENYAPVQDDDGVWVIEAKLIEFNHPTVGLSKPDGVPATPADPEDAEIKAKELIKKGKDDQIAKLSKPGR
jgi:hypothetical protein